MAELEFKHQESLTSGTNKIPSVLPLVWQRCSQPNLLWKAWKDKSVLCCPFFCRSVFRRCELSVRSHTITFFFSVRVEGKKRDRKRKYVIRFKSQTKTALDFLSSPTWSLVWKCSDCSAHVWDRCFCWELPSLPINLTTEGTPPVGAWLLSHSLEGRCQGPGNRQILPSVQSETLKLPYSNMGETRIAWSSSWDTQVFIFHEFLDCISLCIFHIVTSEMFMS